MRRTDIPVFSGRLDLADAPLNPDWVLEGNPRTRNRMLWNSGDKTGFSMMWDCTAGKFYWIYDFDELVHIVDGGVTVTGPDGVSHVLAPGDVVLFRQGMTVHWHVERYVRKIAYCHHQLPEAVALPIRAWRRVKALFVRPAVAAQKSEARPGNHVHA